MKPAALFAALLLILPLAADLSPQAPPPDGPALGPAKAKTPAAPAQPAAVKPQAAEPKAGEKAPDKIRPLPVVNDALAMIAADLATLPPDSHPYTRYIWVTTGAHEDMQAVALTMNRLSRAAVILRPWPLKRGPVLVMRVDLRHYAPQFDGRNANDIEDWTRTWEELQFDPRLNLLLTQDTLAFAAGIVPAEQDTVRVRRKQQADAKAETLDGKRRDDAEMKLADLKDLQDIVVARLPGADLDPGIYARLVAMTGSQAPVVTHEYFLFRALSAIRDKDVSQLYDTVWGGLYYEFAGIRTGAKKGTDLDVLLEELGIGNVAAGITADKVFDRLRSDQKIAKFRSDVTAGPRQISLLPSLSGRLDISSRFVSVTNDLKHANIDIGRHPLFNLLEIKPDAHEVIFTKANGLHGYALFNGAGKRQDEAPPDVARDNTIPNPHHQRLQPGIGCISCHEADGSDGWKPVANDAKVLTRSLEIFGDVGQRERSVPDTLDRIAGLYQGEPERIFTRGRDDLAAAVLRSTGPWVESKKAQGDVAKLAAVREVAVYRGYVLDLVTPRRALAELGIDVDEADATKVLGRLLPVRVGLEDPRLAALRAGLGLTRHDWGLAFGFAAARAKDTLQELQGKQQ